VELPEDAFVVEFREDTLVVEFPEDTFAVEFAEDTLAVELRAGARLMARRTYHVAPVLSFQMYISE
jgi:hypothetical protein